MAAATSGAGGKSSAGQDDGLVDDHTYSVIECHANVAGTGVDIFKVRNPWGKGEIEDGQFDDDGPGWKRTYSADLSVSIVSRMQSPVLTKMCSCH